MAAALTLLLIGSVLQGALCGEFKVIIPQTIEVVSGSCVTIPCSFDVENQYKSQLDNTCKALWKKDGVIVFDTDPLRPTLTPSRLEVKEGTSVSLTCSAPAPCLSHPPTLTWTPGLGDSQETLQENQDKTKAQTSVVSFTASHLHHGKTISCTATYNKQDGSTEFTPKDHSVSPSPGSSTREQKCDSDMQQQRQPASKDPHLVQS
ncbi:hypothetical protein ABVT39_012384 [Epinephelus coioides]